MRRMMVAGLAACMVFVSALGSAASAATTINLVHNGGFETPVVASGSFQTFSTGQSFPHWTVVGSPGAVSIVSGTFTTNGLSFPARSGHQWLDLTGFNSNSATGVAQTVTTTPGTHYTLRFAVGNVVDPGGAFGTASTVDVAVDGSQILAATNSNGAGSNSLVWKTFAVGFTATSATATISFINGDPSNDNSNGLDAVNLVAS